MVGLDSLRVLWYAPIHVASVLRTAVCSYFQFACPQWSRDNLGTFGWQTVYRLDYYSLTSVLLLCGPKVRLLLLPAAGYSSCLVAVRSCVCFRSRAFCLCAFGRLVSFVHFSLFAVCCVLQLLRTSGFDTLCRFLLVQCMTASKAQLRTLHNPYMQRCYSLTLG